VIVGRQTAQFGRKLTTDPNYPPRIQGESDGIIIAPHPCYIVWIARTGNECLPENRADTVCSEDRPGI